MKLNRKKLFFWLKIVIIIYCSIGIALYYLQDRFLFHPKKLDADYTFKFSMPFEEMAIPVNKTDTISMIKFLPPGTMRRGVVVYFHGNVDNVEHYADFVPGFTKHGYEVWMPDYPGYGKSSGERNEKKLYEQAWLVKQMAMGKFHSDSIVIYGKSLGTGIAAYAASVSKCRQLILETPYYSIPDMFNHYAFIYPTSSMCNYKIPTHKFLEDVKVPVTIFHGNNDGVIPYSCAEKLKTVLKPTDKFITIDKGKHNNLAGFENYKLAMDSLLR
jgi:uncharacterized protein